MLTRLREHDRIRLYWGLRPATQIETRHHMIDITALTNQLAEQDRALRKQFAGIVDAETLDPATRAIVETLAVGLAAINERQADLITLLVRTSA